MDFTNREIATYIWIAILAIVSVLNHKIRQSVKEVIHSFCNKFIIIPLVLATIYITGIVLVLKYIGIWTSTNLKTTIIWGVSFAFMTMFDTSRVTKYNTYFIKAVKEAIGLTSILTFIVEFYSFNLIVELITVPFLAFLAMMHAASTKPNHTSLKHILSILLNAIGFTYLGYSIYSTIINFNDVLTLNTAREFFVPILLTFCFLPFLFALMIYIAYERSFIGINWGIKEAKL